MPSASSATRAPVYPQERAAVSSHMKRLNIVPPSTSAQFYA